MAGKVQASVKGGDKGLQGREHIILLSGQAGNIWGGVSSPPGGNKVGSQMFHRGHPC